MSGSDRSRRVRRRRALTAALGVVLLGVGGWMFRDPGLPAACAVTLADGDHHLSRTEAMTATTVVAVGTRDGHADAAIAAALDSALDSEDQPLDADAAAGHYDGDGDTDATPASRDLARALLGTDGPALTCRVSPVTREPWQAEGHDGLTPRARAALEALQGAFGDQEVGGFAPGGVDSGHTAGSAHYDGRAVDVFYRPVDDANRARGWATAQWLVAHAEDLDLATVIYDDRVWSRRRSVQGWRDYTPPGGPTDNAVLRHLDHVHVDVVEGG